MTSPAPGGGFNVDPETIGAVAGTFEAQADALAEAIQALGSRLSTDGACWGTDTEGAMFGSAYQPAASQMQSDLGDLVTGLERIAAALRASAASYQAADTATAGSLAPAQAPAPAPTRAPTSPVTA